MKVAGVLDGPDVLEGGLPSYLQRQGLADNNTTPPDDHSPKNDAERRQKAHVLGRKRALATYGCPCK